MGRRKKRKMKPFCFYCDRTFDEEMVLVTHQKAKHFKCHHCHKRLGSAHALTIHVFQVHKETIKSVPNARKGRDDLELNIFGMSGIPEDVMEEKQAEAMGLPPPKKSKKVAASEIVDPAAAALAGAGVIPPYPMVPPPHGHRQPPPPPPHMMGMMPLHQGPPPPLGMNMPPPRPYGVAGPSGYHLQDQYAPPRPPYGSSNPPPQQHQAQSIPPPPQQPVQPAVASSSNELMIWSDEESSVEEKRAAMPKYDYSISQALGADVLKLEQSIEDRLKQMQQNV